MKAQKVFVLGGLPQVTVLNFNTLKDSIKTSQDIKYLLNCF